MTAHFLGQSPVFCFFFYLFTWCSKWTLLRHVKNNTGQRHQQRNEFEKWNHVLFFFFNLFFKKNKRKVLCCYREYNRQPQKKKRIFRGYYRLSLSLLYSIELLFYALCCECLHQQAHQPKKKKEIPFEIVIVITVVERSCFFVCFCLFFFFPKSHRIDRSEGRTNNNNNKHITRRKRVSGLSISRVLTTSWAWHGRQNLFFSILFGCLTCFLQFAFIR